MNKILVLGSSGLLGQAIVKKGKKLGYQVIGAARNKADIVLDVQDENALTNVIHDQQPDVVVNTVAIVNLAACEKNPAMAYKVNARPASVIADLAKKQGFKSIYISTDHYYSGDDRAQHKETDPVTILNEYAKTKHEGEVFASEDQNGLVIRTNIIGHRWQEENPTFAEWVLDALENHKPLTLFNDVFTSPIHVNDFAKAMFNLLDKDACGIINLASSEVSSKKEFIHGLAKNLGILLDWETESSGKSLSPPRADSMGLNVNKAEQILEYSLPTLQETLATLVQNHPNNHSATV